MTDILDAKKRLNAFDLTSNTKKGCIFVLLLFIFFAAVEYWASPGCDSGINAESRSGRRVFGLRHLDSKGKLLTAIAQEFLCASDCMLVPRNQGDSQQLLDGSGGCVFLSDCCHCQKCQPLSYRPARMTHVCCPLVVLNGLLLTSWMIYCHGGVISHIDSCEGWNGTERCFVVFFLSTTLGSLTNLCHSVLSGSRLCQIPCLGLTMHMPWESARKCYWFFCFHGAGSLIWVLTEQTVNETLSFSEFNASLFLRSWSDCSSVSLSQPLIPSQSPFLSCNCAVDLSSVSKISSLTHWFIWCFCVSWCRYTCTSEWLLKLHFPWLSLFLL